MPKTEFSMNQLGLILEAVRSMMSRIKDMADHNELAIVEDKIIDIAFKGAKAKKEASVTQLAE